MAANSGESTVGTNCRVREFPTTAWGFWLVPNVSPWSRPGDSGLVGPELKQLDNTIRAVFERSRPAQDPAIPVAVVSTAC